MDGSGLRTMLTALAGFAPWILYWALLGNVSFRTAVLAAVVLSLAVSLRPLLTGRRPMDFDLGTTAVLLVMLLLILLTGTALERWIQPLTNAGLLAVAGTLQLLGRPFTLPYARAAVDEETAAQPGFRWINRVISAAWCAAFALMTLISAVPPVVQGDAAVHEGGSMLSILCYWVLPFTVLGLVAAASGAFPNWFVARLDAPAPPTCPDPARMPPVVPPAERDGVRVELEAYGVDGPAVLRSSPGVAASVRLGQPDVDGVWWWAETEVTAEQLGAGVDLAPLVCRMRPDGEPDVFAPPLEGELVALVCPTDGAPVGVRAPWRFAPEGLCVEEVDTDGVIGRLYAPDEIDSAGPRPGVVLFPGSEGGLDSQAATAAWLAAHGYVALVAATSGVPARPDNLAAFPLERFADAVRHLVRRPEVRADQVVAMAISKGAEGLLACAARVDLGVSGLVLVSPSDATWQAVGADGPVMGTSSWTFEGVPVDYRPLDGEALMPQLLRNAVRSGADRRRGRVATLRLRPAYALPHQDPTGQIDVRAVAAPLLLVAGDADELWPSSAMAEAIARRRGRYDDRLIVQPGAGHLILPAYRPTTGTSTDGIAFGGEAEATGRAGVALGAEVLAFLRQRTASSLT